MKKLYVLIAALAITASANAQSQRLVLVEEFTGETCGPCASQNPGFNAIMSANSTKGITIKYQNNIPSTGPNFYLYNTADIATRTTYYANNYSPHGFLDGNVWDDVIGNFTPTELNNRFAVTSPFDVIVTHTISPLGDSIYSHTVVRATMPYTGTTLKLRVVVVESDVFGYTSPNGESDYSNVMRKFLPNAGGTTLQASWQMGDSVVTDLAWKIAASPTSYPGPVPMQLKVISFVQNDTGKEVLQAGASHAQIPMDPQALAIGALSPVSCVTSVAPTVDFANNGVTTITSLDIQYRVDAGTWQTYNWTGSLAPWTSTSVTLPSVAVTSGSHTFNVNLLNPNGGVIDNNTANNAITRSFAVPVAPVAGSVAEPFTVTTFPPANWIRMNYDSGPTWTRVTQSAYGTGTGSTKIDFYNSNAGEEDDLYLYPLDMTLASGATLTFDVAHKRYSAAYVDKLEVFVSTDCGQTWTSVFMKSGAALATLATYQTTAYAPAAADWRAESASLNGFIGSPSVMVAFKATSGYGNNAFVDNINVTVVTGINDVEVSNAISVYPNPAKGNVNVAVSLKDTKSVNFILTDLSGKEVMQQQAKGSMFTQTLNLKNVAAGTYLLKVEIDGKSTVKKITVE